MIQEIYFEDYEGQIKREYAERITHKQRVGNKIQSKNLKTMNMGTTLTQNLAQLGKLTHPDQSVVKKDDYHEITIFFFFWMLGRS